MIFKTPDFFILNKPCRSHFDEAVLQSLESDSSLKNEGDWEAVHRLDYETSGCLLVAKLERVLELRKMFQAGIIKKSYVAGATRRLGPEVLGVELQGYIGSRYRSSKKVSYVDARFIENLNQMKKKFHSFQPTQHLVKQGGEALVRIARENLGFTGEIYEVDLISGVRHQIRAFFAEADAALVGDPIYGSGGPGDPTPKGRTSEMAPNTHQVEPLTPGVRLELHAYRLAFKDPFTGQAVDVVADRAAAVADAGA